MYASTNHKYTITTNPHILLKNMTLKKNVMTPIGGKDLMGRKDQEDTQDNKVVWDLRGRKD
jgi:hypothetical protein